MNYDFAWLFLSFKGRSSRQEFWLGYVGIIVVLYLLQFPLETLSLYFFRPMGRQWSDDELLLALFAPRLLAAAISMWPLAAISVKRLHDISLSGWWLPVFWLAGFVLGIIPGRRGSNRFGDDPLAYKRT
jgi:uncharacterized membrane protein YhaH (DUF805 family)